MGCCHNNVRTAVLVFLAAAIALAGASAADAQTGAQPRRLFVTVSFDNHYTQPLHFLEWPVRELVGREVAEAQRESYEYRSRDELTTVDVLEFRRRGRGFGVTVYPFGMAAGSTLGIRASREELPVIRLAVSGPANVSSYALTDAHALDASVGVYTSDRAPGWGLGSHAFVAGGAGVIRSTLSDGHRVFAEGGGGLSVGPIGVELAVKFALNRLDGPVRHQFLTVPIALRTSVSF
jgi:hypothetical protein